jgi:hypothetical protein
MTGGGRFGCRPSGLREAGDLGPQGRLARVGRAVQLDDELVAAEELPVRRGIQTDDFEGWKEQHELHAPNRARYGITDGPAYRDLDDPGAALFHISVQDMDTAMGWFRSDTFKEATRLAKVTSRSFYLAQPQT